MNPFLVIGFPTIATPLWNIANLPDTSGLAPRMDPEVIRTTLEMATTMMMTTMTLSTPWMS